MGKKSVYLINPRNDFPNYYGGEVFGAELGKPGVMVSDLAVTTVAALMKPYFNVLLCDQHIDDVDYSLDVDFVAVTGKITQWYHAREIAIKFRKRGIPVIIGGPYASLSPDTVQPYADILVTGELEEVYHEVFSEINSGKWKARYEGIQADMANSVVPAWDQYPNHRSLAGNLQVSRGCPFQCEFCDVIQYLGRKQRHKPIPNMLRELDELHRIGYTNSFIADDNFTVYRSRAKEVLEALEAWNNAVPGRTHTFTTQVSMDVTKDEEILELLNRAGFTSVFIGIESPDENSLKETRKLQNTKIDIVKEVERINAHGVAVFAGMIVGFDNDGTGIFERQFEFAMQSSIPFFSLNYLYAFESTPLYQRLKDTGRIIEYDDRPFETQYSTNVQMKQLSKEEQYFGMRWLLSNLYAPDYYGDRLCSLISKLGHARVKMQTPLGRGAGTVKGDLIGIIKNLRRRGEREKLMVDRVLRRIDEKPNSAPVIMYFLYLYAQVRFLLDQQPPDMPMYVPDEIGRPAFSLV